MKNTFDDACDYLGEELTEINKFRRSVGLPVLVKRTFRCMRCSREFKALRKTAWCHSCKDVTERATVGLPDYLW